MFGREAFRAPAGPSSMSRLSVAESNAYQKFQNSLLRACAPTRRTQPAREPTRATQDAGAYLPAQALSAALGAVAASQLFYCSAATALPDTRKLHQPTLSVERAWIESYLLQDAHDRLAEMPDNELLSLFQQALRHEHPDLVGSSLGSTLRDGPMDMSKPAADSRPAPRMADSPATDQPAPSASTQQPAYPTAAAASANSSLAVGPPTGQGSPDLTQQLGQRDQAGAQLPAQPSGTASNDAPKQGVGRGLSLSSWRTIPLPELPRLPDLAQVEHSLPFLRQLHPWDGAPSGQAQQRQSRDQKLASFLQQQQGSRGQKSAAASSQQPLADPQQMQSREQMQASPGEKQLQTSGDAQQAVPQSNQDSAQTRQGDSVRESERNMQVQALPMEGSTSAKTGPMAATSTSEPDRTQRSGAEPRQGQDRSDDEDEVDETERLLLAQPSTTDVPSESSLKSPQRSGGSVAQPAANRAAEGWPPALPGLQLPSSGTVMAGAAQFLPPALALGAAAVLAKALWNIVDWTGDPPEDGPAEPQDGASASGQGDRGSRASPDNQPAPGPDRSSQPVFEPLPPSQALPSGQASSVELPQVPQADVQTSAVLMPNGAQNFGPEQRLPVPRQEWDAAVQAAVSFWQKDPPHHHKGIHDLRAASSAASIQEDPAWTAAEARVSPEMLQQMTSGGSSGGILWRRSSSPQPLQCQAGPPETETPAGSHSSQSRSPPSQELPDQAAAKPPVPEPSLSRPAAGDQPATDGSPKVLSGANSPSPHPSQLSSAALSDPAVDSARLDKQTPPAGGSRRADQTQGQQKQVNGNGPEHWNAPSMYLSEQLHAEREASLDQHQDQFPAEATGCGANGATAYAAAHDDASSQQSTGGKEATAAASVRNGQLSSWLEGEMHDGQRKDPWMTPLGWDHSSPASQGVDAALGAGPASKDPGNGISPRAPGSSHKHAVPSSHGPSWQSASQTALRPPAARHRHLHRLLDNCE